MKREGVMFRAGAALVSAMVVTNVAFCPSVVGRPGALPDPPKHLLVVTPGKVHPGERFSVSGSGCVDPSTGKVGGYIVRVVLARQGGRYDHSEVELTPIKPTDGGTFQGTFPSGPAAGGDWTYPDEWSLVVACGLDGAIDGPGLAWLEYVYDLFVQPAASPAAAPAAPQPSAPGYTG